jgi:hypothetical protein
VGAGIQFFFFFFFSSLHSLLRSCLLSVAAQLKLQAERDRENLFGGQKQTKRRQQE